MIYLITETIIVALSSFIFTKRIYGQRGTSEFALIWFVLLFSQILLVQLVLGSIGRFYFADVFIFQIAILLISLIFLRKDTFVFVKPDIKPFIDSKLLILAFSVFSAFFLVKGYLNLINPPMSADSLQYHLAFPAFWIKNGNLNNPFCIFGSVPTLNQNSLEMSGISYFPINAELFFAWLMMPLRNAFLADLGEAPFYFIGIIVIYAILRKYGVNKKISLLSGFLWVLIPNIFKQLKYASQIDVICAVMFFLVFYTALLLRERFSLKYSVLFGISAGFFIGSKFINAVWFAGIMPLILYLLYDGVKTHKPRPGKVIVLFGSMFLMALLFGGYMYIKNFIHTGNPIFPADIKLFGLHAFKGLVDRDTYQMVCNPGDQFNLGKLMLREGLGIQFLAMILPCVFLPIIFCGYLKNKAARFYEYLLLFIAPLLMFLLYSIFLNVCVGRYLFPFLGMGLVSSVIFITKFRHGEKYLMFISFIAIIAGAFEFSHRYELIISILLSFSFFMLLYSYRRQISDFYKSRAFTKFILMAMAAAAVFFVYFNAKYDREEFLRYTLGFSKKELWQKDIGIAWMKLNEITGKGARVAYTGRQEFYPMFGEKLKNDVEYVSVNEKKIAPYNKPDGLYRKEKSYPAWQKNLKEDKINYLFVALPFFSNKESSDPNEFPIEDKWALEHPELFRPVYRNSLAHIYLVVN